MRAAIYHSRRRGGFTLLEVLLASSIATLLFGALYVAMQVQLRQAAEGREVIEKATLARAVINRFTLDLGTSLTPPRSKPKSKSTSSSSAASNSTSTISTDTTATDTTAQMAEQLTTAVPLQAGVIGESDRLVIFTSRVPDPKKSASLPGQMIPSDIRRISYWLGENGGLCRQEIGNFSGDAYYAARDHVLEDGKSDDQYVIASEVTELGFEYYDINGEGAWVDFWDGTALGPDGMTPIGPPSTIRVRFVLRTTTAMGEVSTREFRHVVPIITASGPDVMEAVPSEMEMTETTTTGTGTTP